MLRWRRCHYMMMIILCKTYLTVCPRQGIYYLTSAYLTWTKYDFALIVMFEELASSAATSLNIVASYIIVCSVPNSTKIVPQCNRKTFTFKIVIHQILQKIIQSWVLVLHFSHFSHSYIHKIVYFLNRDQSHNKNL